ncbi:hypothetical protein BSZ36_02285 [Rubricoccus marinus]|uniref:Uncharacterized protein n=1 Tax=Rubricoccus marinus TaxID=716817 RepID=A0A259TW44_9BACT|nr:hypothetical protein BSZ36_02285 [Rubricoccus marinus]
MSRFGFLLCAALALSGASAAQVLAPAASPAPEADVAPEASWLAVMASGVHAMPMREPTRRVLLRPIVLDLRGPEPPAFQMAPMLGEPPQVRRSRERRQRESGD